MIIEVEPWAGLIVGLLLILGSLGAVWVLGRYWAEEAHQRLRNRPSNQSLLAPVLAVDALDDDLRLLYVETIAVDVRAETLELDDPHALGRELRKLIITLQVGRRSLRSPNPPAGRVAAAAMSASSETVQSVLERVVTLSDAGELDGAALGRMRATTRDARFALRSPERDDLSS